MAAQGMKPYVKLASTLVLVGTGLCLAATVVLAARVRQRDVDAHELAPDDELSPATGA